MSKLTVTNPANYLFLGEIPVSTEEEITLKVANASKAKKHWKETGILKRIELLKEVFDKFTEKKTEIGNLLTQEMGMPVSVRDDIEINPGLDFFKWYLENSEKYLSPEVTLENDKVKNTVYLEPSGVAAIISPWNFPFSNFIWSVIPNLIVGNPVVFKHSEECPISGKLYEEIIADCHLPEGVFNEIYGDGKVGDCLVHQDIDLICFTGSTKTGKYLYRLASEKFIPIHLELGGSAPGIVFEDADLDKVIETIYFNRFCNSGQVCDGLKRLIVHQSKFDEVVNKLKSILEKKRVGDPSDPQTEIGPLVSKKQLDLLNSQVEDALKNGAKLICGGKSPNNLKGAFYLPTIITNVNSNMRILKEETFGPLLPVMSFRDEEEAISLANDTDYGLGGYVFTEDAKRAERVAAKLETGMVGVNNANYFHPENPWGGYKLSGLGRGNGRYGLRELCQTKVISIERQK